MLFLELRRQRVGNEIDDAEDRLGFALAVSHVLERLFTRSVGEVSILTRFSSAVA